MLSVLRCLSSSWLTCCSTRSTREQQSRDAGSDFEESRRAQADDESAFHDMPFGELQPATGIIRIMVAARCCCSVLLAALPQPDRTKSLLLLPSLPASTAMSSSFFEWLVAAAATNSHARVARSQAGVFLKYQLSDDEKDALACNLDMPKGLRKYLFSD